VTVVFSCSNQDQSLDSVDFASLRSRLRQNSVQEKLTKQWIDRSLRKIGFRLPPHTVPACSGKLCTL
jgi:hypothetical protein